MCVFVCECVLVQVCVCMYVYMSVCVPVCICPYTSVHIVVHTKQAQQGRQMLQHTHQQKGIAKFDSTVCLSNYFLSTCQHSTRAHIHMCVHTDAHIHMCVHTGAHMHVRNIQTFNTSTHAH